MDRPLISVLLCVYNPNKEQFREAVDSIIGQTFTQWEMILYDDGSEEEYKKFIHDISCLDERIRYLRNEKHNFLAYGLNEAMKLATGKYLARMDADDISHPTRFEKQFKFLEEHLLFMWVGSNISVMDESGNVWGERRYPKSPGKEAFLKYSPYAHPTIMIRRGDLLRYGGYKTGQHPYRSEDYELFMRLHAAGEQGYNLQENLLNYREYEEAYKKRTFKFQYQEMLVRFEGFRRLKILNPKTFCYVLKPMIVWAIPNKLIYALKHK